MLTYFDSSAFVKRYLNESGSEIVDQLCSESTSVALSSIAIPEIFSALNRRVNDKSISKRDYKKIKTVLLEEVEDIEVINLVPEVIAEAIKVLESNKLRAMDSIHIGSAIIIKPDIFITSDKRQFLAAKKSGLKIKLIT